jgi:hypothetical protein
MGTRDELKVRQRLEGSLGVRFLEPTWSRLRKPWVEEYLKQQEGYETGITWEELEGQAKVEYDHQERLRREILGESLEEEFPGSEPSRSLTEGKDTRRPPQARAFKLTSWENARANARSMHVAELADKHPLVRRFRTIFLGDAWPLTEEAMDSLVESYAAAFFPLRWFQQWGIDLIHPSSSIEGEYYRGGRGSDVDHRVTVRVRCYGADITKRVRYAHKREPLSDQESIDSQNIVANGSDRVKEPYLEYVLDPEERPGCRWVWPGSVLDTLLRVCSALSNRYPWDKTQAGWFVLSGITPLISPIEANYQEQTDSTYAQQNRQEVARAGWTDEQFIGVPDTAEINLTIEPWVSPDRVREVYQDLRLRVVGNRKQPWEQNLRVYAFVKARQGEVERSALPALWNREAQKDWRYAHPQGFWQAYNRAKRAIEGSTYYEFSPHKW